MVALTTSLGGCIFVSKKPRSKQQAVSHKCEPSHYWDGEQCRHKGKGKGARKHDHR